MSLEANFLTSERTVKTTYVLPRWTGTKLEIR